MKIFIFHILSPVTKLQCFCNFSNFKLFFSHISYSDWSFPILPIPSPPIHSSYISLQKRYASQGHQPNTALQVAAMMMMMMINRHLSLYQARWGSIIREKGSQSQAKESETAPTSNVRSSMRKSSYTTINIIPDTSWSTRNQRLVTQRPWIVPNKTWEGGKGQISQCFKLSKLSIMNWNPYIKWHKTSNSLCFGTLLSIRTFQIKFQEFFMVRGRYYSKLIDHRWLVSRHCYRSET